jgi:hypothetical protein
MRKKKDYRIEPPPKDKGTEPLFRVIYVIDVGAADERKAAETAWQQMMRAEDAFDPVMVILDSNGKQTKLDLSEYIEFNKITTGFVIQKYRKRSTGKFRCIHQEFIAGDDVQFENLKGDSIEPPEHEYQPFNMTLVSRDKTIDRLNDMHRSIDAGDHALEEVQRRNRLKDKLAKLANEAEGIKASLPTLPLEKWFDGTIEDATIDVFFEEYDLGKLLRLIADVGVSI